MKNFLPFALILATFLPLSLRARDADWLQQRMREIEETEKLQDEGQKIEALSSYLLIGYNSGRDEEQDRVFQRAKKDIVEITGYAKYYQDDLEKLRRLTKDDSTYSFQYGKAQKKIFQSLGQLPSPETVRVMGDFLNDPEGRNGKDIAGDPISVWNTVNCKMAVGVLLHLKIEKAPVVKAGQVSFEDVDAWKQWWDEIKSGKRTYRFVGSPVEYGPDGPVSAKELSRREHDRQSSPRTGNVGTQEVASPPESLGIGSKVAAGIALVLLAAGGWFAFGKRKGVA